MELDGICLPLAKFEMQVYVFKEIEIAILTLLFFVWIAKVSGSKGALELISIVFSRHLAQ